MRGPHIAAHPRCNHFRDVAEDFTKATSWYDDEWGYSTRLVDLVATMAVKDGAVSQEKALA